MRRQLICIALCVILWCMSILMLFYTQYSASQVEGLVFESQLRHTSVVKRGNESSTAKWSAVGVSVMGTRRGALSMDGPCHSCCVTLKKLYSGMLRQVIKFKTERGTHALWCHSFRSKWRIYSMNINAVNQIVYRFNYLKILFMLITT